MRECAQDVRKHKNLQAAWKGAIMIMKYNFIFMLCLFSGFCELCDLGRRLSWPDNLQLIKIYLQVCVLRFVCVGDTILIWVTAITRSNSWANFPASEQRECWTVSCCISLLWAGIIKHCYAAPNPERLTLNEKIKHEKNMTIHIQCLECSIAETWRKSFSHVHSSAVVFHDISLT